VAERKHSLHPYRRFGHVPTRLVMRIAQLLRIAGRPMPLAEMAYGRWGIPTCGHATPDGSDIPNDSAGTGLDQFPALVRLRVAERTANLSRAALELTQASCILRTESACPLACH